jgi:uncharacterized surface protein with fasciclin (FAS1) repeats
MKTIIDTATAAGKFTTLLNAFKAAALTDSMRAAGAYTVFAPTDEAFTRLPAGALNVLLKDRKKLKGVLEYHMVAGTLAGNDLKTGEITTVEGTALVLATQQDGRVTVNGAKILQADIDASNGVIHAINAVLLPQGTTLAAAA